MVKKKKKKKDKGKWEEKSNLHCEALILKGIRKEMWLDF